MLDRACLCQPLFDHRRRGGQPLGCRVLAPVRGVPRACCSGIDRLGRCFQAAEVQATIAEHLSGAAEANFYAAADLAQDTFVRLLRP